MKCLQSCITLTLCSLKQLITLTSLKSAAFSNCWNSVKWANGSGVMGLKDVENKNRCETSDASDRLGFRGLEWERRIQLPLSGSSLFGQLHWNRNIHFRFVMRLINENCVHRALGAPDEHTAVFLWWLFHVFIIYSYVKLCDYDDQG